MNFQPPKPVQRRVYIDGISVVKSSVAPLQPIVRTRMVTTREPVLAHRVIHVSNANRLGLPTPKVGNSSLAHMPQLVAITRPAAASGRKALMRYASFVASGVRSMAAAAADKNWHAFVPARYKKYSAASGVTVNRTFKSHGATFMIAVLVLLTIGLWPGAVNTHNTSPIAASGAAITAQSSAGSKATTQESAPTAGAVTSAESVAGINTEQTLWEATAAAKQDQLPVHTSSAAPVAAAEAPAATPVVTATPPVVATPVSPADEDDTPTVPTPDSDPATPETQEPAPTPAPTAPATPPADSAKGEATGGSIEVTAELPLVGGVGVGL